MLMHYSSHWGWKRWTLSTTLPSLSSTPTYKKQQTNQSNKNPDENPTKIRGCQHKPIPTFNSNSLLGTNHTKQFAREEPTRSRMNQQGSAKPEKQECFQAPEAQAGTTGGWFSDTHEHLLKHLLLQVGTTQHKATRHLPPQGPDPKTEITPD